MPGFTRPAVSRRRRTTRRTVIGGLALTATVVLGGCTAIDGTAVRADGPAGRSTPGASTPPSGSSRASDLVPDASAFPAGYSVVEVPQAQVQEALDAILAATRAAQVTPRECIQVSLVPESMDLSQVGLATATKGTDALGVAVMDSAAGASSLDDQRKAVSGTCEHLEMKFEISGEQVESRVTQKAISAPETKAAATLVVEQTQQMTISGRQVTSHARLGYAEVNGYTVSVTATAPTGGPLDEKAFESLYVAAVNKVVDET